MRRQLARLHVSLMNEMRGMHALLSIMAEEIGALQQFCAAFVGVPVSNGAHPANGREESSNAERQQ